MRPWSRVAAGSMAVAVAALLTSPMALGQGPSPVAFAPGTACALLTADEVAAGLGFEVSGSGGTRLDCTWSGDASTGVTSGLSLVVAPGDVLDQMPVGASGSTDVSIPDDSAYYSDGSLWVASDSDTLELRLTPGVPEVADPQTALTTLARLAAGRIDSLSSTPATALPVASAGRPADIDACALIPLADAQAISPFTTPFAHIEQPEGPDVPGMCEYWALTDRSRAVIELVVGTVSPPPDPSTWFDQSQQDASDRGLMFEHLDGLGDGAVAFGGPDEVVVEAVSGTHTLSTHLYGEWNSLLPDPGVPAKVAAGEHLLQLVIDRLP